MAKAKSEKGGAGAQDAVARAKEYVEAYIDKVRSKGLTGDNAPTFFKSYPYSVRCYPLSNGGMLVFYKKGKTLDFKAVGKEEVTAGSHDFVIYHPRSEMQSGGLRGRGTADAERDCAIALAMASLEKAKEDAIEISTSTDKLVKNNPWLDAFASGNKAMSERLRRVIEEQTGALRKEVAALASEQRAILMELALEITPVGEEIAQEEEATLALRARVDVLEKDWVDKWRQLAADMGVIADVAHRVDAIGTDLDSLQSKMTKESEEGGGSKKIKETLAAINERLEAVQAELEQLKSDAEITEEIKGTVFRDSKRMHNMNDRINALEEEVKKATGSERFAELKKRVDALDRRMTSEVSIAVAEALAVTTTRPEPDDKKKRKK